MAATAFVLFAMAGTPAAQDHQASQPVSAHHTAEVAALFPPAESSGTAWQPALTPMAGVHGRVGQWTVTGHANVFAQFLYESGDIHRTSRQVGSINWFMGVLRRPMRRGRVGVRAMLSAEPWTIAGCGYPDLLATGEICDGDSIHDRQHPHELFMELAVDYDRPITNRLRVHAYAALAGEPALGPPAFLHRASAMPNPIAPIGHHWLDATHISFGVVTAGVSGSRWRAEGSAFNGREPDEARAGLEFAALDSVAARLSVAPNARWSLQVSAGLLHDAEAGLGSQPRQDVSRATASVMHVRHLRGAGAWAWTIAYGVNHEGLAVPGAALQQTSVPIVRPMRGAGANAAADGSTSHDTGGSAITTVAQATHAALAETSLRSASGRHQWFARMEVVGKPAHDLHVHEYPSTIFIVGKAQVGYLRQMRTVKGWAPGIGAHLSLSLVPAFLAPRYSGRVAPGFGVFANLQPAR